MINAELIDGNAVSVDQRYKVCPPDAQAASKHWISDSPPTQSSNELAQKGRGRRMRSISTKLILSLAITATAAFAADNSLGTWKLNMEKSKFSPAAPVKSLTTTREASDGGVKITSTGDRADGTPINASYTAKYDGKEYPVTGSPYDTIAIKQVNANTFTFTQKKNGGKYNVSGRSVVSKDGKMTTSTLKGTNAEGKAYHATMVYEKQ